MPEVDTKFNYGKDYDQIKIDEAFLHTNLDNISDAAPLWLDTRTAIFKKLVETDGLYEYLIDYATHSDVEEEDLVELIVRNEYGKTRGFKRLAGLPKNEVEFRTSNIIQAHLPVKSSWFIDFRNRDKDKPLLTWFKELDDTYLASDEETKTQSQRNLTSLRWKCNVPLKTHMRRYMELLRIH